VKIPKPAAGSWQPAVFVMARQWGEKRSAIGSAASNRAHSPLPAARCRPIM